MKVEGVRITWIAPEEEMEHKDRPGFSGVCTYGSMVTERNELGSIVRPAPKTSSWLNPESGVWVTTVIVVERIFVVAPE